MIISPEHSTLLSHLGLHPQGVILYIDLLEHQSSPIHTMSTRTGLERTIIYRRLPELLDRGLITREIHGKRYWYRANSPELLAGLLTDMSQNLE